MITDDVKVERKWIHKRCCDGIEIDIFASKAEALLVEILDAYLYAAATHSGILEREASKDEYYFHIVPRQIEQGSQE